MTFEFVPPRPLRKDLDPLEVYEHGGRGGPGLSLMEEECSRLSYLVMPEGAEEDEDYDGYEAPEGSTWVEHPFKTYFLEMLKQVKNSRTAYLKEEADLFAFAKKHSIPFILPDHSLFHPEVGYVSETYGWIHSSATC